MRTARAWSFLAIEGKRQYGGNTGYDDDPSAIYRYDSDVANHRNVKSADVAIVRSSLAVLGIATIETVVEGTGQKARQRCPVCGSVSIKARTNQLPRWRCTSGHLFDDPVEELAEVATFEAHYAGTFQVCPEITLAALASAVMRPSDQMSIKELDLARLEQVLFGNPASAVIIRNYTRSLNVISTEHPAGSDNKSIIEERRRVLREIALRRGQARFRRRLIGRYGAACQISGCAFTGLIEAAHVSPYALSSDNSADNGLLLRSDLHTLFDLGLLGIIPQTLEVLVHPAAKLSGYDLFDGKLLHVNFTSGPSLSALEERWLFFQDRLSSWNGTE